MFGEYRQTYLLNLKGAGGGLHQNSLEIDFIVVSDLEGSDVYQLVLVPCS